MALALIKFSDLTNSNVAFSVFADDDSFHFIAWENPPVEVYSSGRFFVEGRLGKVVRFDCGDLFAVESKVAKFAITLLSRQSGTLDVNATASGVAITVGLAIVLVLASVAKIGSLTFTCIWAFWLAVAGAVILIILNLKENPETNEFQTLKLIA